MDLQACSSGRGRGARRTRPPLLALRPARRMRAFLFRHATAGSRKGGWEGVFICTAAHTGRRVRREEQGCGRGGRPGRPQLHACHGRGWSRGTGRWRDGASGQHALLPAALPVPGAHLPRVRRSPPRAGSRLVPTEKALLSGAPPSDAVGDWQRLKIGFQSLVNRTQEI